MTVHVPVMTDEVLQYLDARPGMLIVDGTLGGGGHAERLLPLILPGGQILALDRDPQAVAAGRLRFANQPVLVVESNFCDLPQVLESQGLGPADGIVLDLGLSSDQLADQQRGFSFDTEGELDLRFSPESGEPAWRLLQRLPERDLADLIFQLGEERYSRRVARTIVAERRKRPIRTARELAELVRRCVPRSPRMRIDPATRTFQALRIAVNDELGSLEQALERFPDCLKPGGRLAVISFHSLEDRLVKHAFRQDARYAILTKKPIRPNEAELQRNARSRSARLRVAARAGDARPA